MMFPDNCQYYCAVKGLSDKICGIVPADPDSLDYSAPTVAAWKAAGLTVRMCSGKVVSDILTSYGMDKCNH